VGCLPNQTDPTRGSKPAQTASFSKRCPRRAEFFALPIVVRRRPIAQSPTRRHADTPIRFAFSPPSRYSRGVTKKVLFICTGNFYRSRFAEAVFNFHAVQRKLPWQAYSRGLAIHWADGFLSPFTEAALSERQIPVSHTGPGRIQLTEKDLESADLRIALDRAEHLDMMEQQFPNWTQRIEYWDVPDMPAALPEVALPSIESQILHLLHRLANEP
jgi:protein-tyrosine phosphatase